MRDASFCDSSFVSEAHPLPPSHSCQAVDPWESEAMRDGFSKDIYQNLKDLSLAVASKKNVDPEFLKILQQDIDTLRRVYDKRTISHDSHVWSELYRMNVNLQQVAATMSALAADKHLSPASSSSDAASSASQAPCSSVPFFEEDISIPLVGKIEDPLNLRSDNECPVNKGLQILHDEGYCVRRVKGTGHCLFSSIATHLLMEERLTALLSKLPALKAQGLLGALDPKGCIDTCQQKIREGMPIEVLLQNEKIYDAWVMLLRTMASNWWHNEIRQHGGEREIHLAHAAREMMPELQQNPDDREVCAIYLRHMASMPEHRYGGAPEIFALKTILGIDIHTIDAKELGKTSSQADVYKILPRVMDLSGMWLLYAGSHFDPLYLAGQFPNNMEDVAKK
jgi:hypothetical protein